MLGMAERKPASKQQADGGDWKRRVRELRHKLGLDQVQFAIKLKVSLRAVIYWENGKFSPSRVYQQRIEKLEKSA